MVYVLNYGIIAHVILMRVRTFGKNGKIGKQVKQLHLGSHWHNQCASIQRCWLA